MVKVEARKQTLTLTPVDFIAKLTLHIPNRYQNVRRYAGFYSSNIQRKVRLAKPKDTSQPALEVRSPVKPKWATLIAKVFGEVPIKCPRCGTAMDMVGEGATTGGDADFDQTVPENDGFFNQDLNW